MSGQSTGQTVALELPERTIGQLDALVHQGHFANRQAAVVAAVERLICRALLSPKSARRLSLVCVGPSIWARLGSRCAKRSASG